MLHALSSKKILYYLRLTPSLRFLTRVNASLSEGPPKRKLLRQLKEVNLFPQSLVEPGSGGISLLVVCGKESGMR